MLQLGHIYYLKGRKMAAWTDKSRRLLDQVRVGLSERLGAYIPRSCTHLKGNGGVKGALRSVVKALGQHGFVARLDIASYYKSMQHKTLLGLLDAAGASSTERTVVADYLRLPDRGKTGRGMVASGGLSPLLGGLYLAPLDREMARRKQAGQIGLYVRYMDDIVLVTKTRWQLRRAIAALHGELRVLELRLHATKRFIGRAIRGFDFLGFDFHPGRKLRPSRESIRRLRERARRLYEREGDIHRLRQYVASWQRWIFGGLDGLVSRQGGHRRTTRHILSHLHIPRPCSRDG